MKGLLHLSFSLSVQFTQFGTVMPTYDTQKLDENLLLMVYISLNRLLTSVK
ncbi:MAG: hypothetical protein ACYTXY_13435 [Nostoc sp.]